MATTLPLDFKEKCIECALDKSEKGSCDYNLLYNQWDDALEYVKNLPEDYDTFKEIKYAVKKRDSYPILSLAHSKYMCIIVILANIR
jgi:hypothetical protein